MSSEIKHWSQVLIAVMFGCYVIGCSSSDPDRDDDPEFDTSEGVTGCGENDAVVCADLSALNWGSCEDSLGFAYVDGQCLEMTGCKGDNASYCLFETVEACVDGCVDAVMCNEQAIEGPTNPNWPPDWGDTDTSIAVCDRIFVCYNTGGSSIIEELYKDVDIFIEDNPPVNCPEGTDAWNVAEQVTLTGEIWDRVCAYSLLEDTADIRCWR